MGELSRTIGIAGEQIVISNFLKMVGWDPAVDGLDVKCTIKRHAKGTHGLDGFISYECPLSLYTQENIYISAKYESVKRHTKSNLLKYVNDLISAGECFKYSERYQELTRSQGFKINEKRQSHVLFCLNHDSEDDNTVIKVFKSIYDEVSGETDGVYLIDNQRLKFLYLCMKSIKEQTYTSGYSYEFYYHKTGVNESHEYLVGFSGKILPVQFINSPVIPVKIKNGKMNVLLLYVRENFDKDIFKRMVGLAQNLTNGWGNKVVIYFPDYNIKYKLDKEYILHSLKDKDFASIVHVSAYDQTFKMLEHKNDEDFIEEYNSKDNPNADSLLPLGERMRQLINQSYIDKRDLHTLLKRRGVIVKKNWSKKDLIPLFRKIILSPTEFEYLRLRQIAKEYADKRVYREIKAVHEDVISFITEDKIPLNDIVAKVGNGCNLLNSTLTRKDGDLVLSYQIQKQDISKDWSNINSVYKGEILFKESVKYLDAFKNNVSMMYDSVDTRLINKAIFDTVLGQLKADGSAQELPPVIMYSSELDNENRNKFLLSITDICEKNSKIISFRDVISVDTVFVEKGNGMIPQDLIEFTNRVRNSSFEGNNIHQLKYLNDDRYRNFFVVKEVVAEYDFIINEEPGVFKVEYGYPAYKGDAEGKSEFEFKITLIKILKDENISRKDYQLIENALKDEMGKIIISKYDFIEKRYGKQMNFMNDLI